jgi:large subunit ribosomal protein L32
MSRRRKLMRRNHDKLSLNHLVRCETCGKYHQAHHVCPNCGSYNGRQVLEIDDETTNTNE